MDSPSDIERPPGMHPFDALAVWTIALVAAIVATVGLAVWVIPHSNENGREAAAPTVALTSVPGNATAPASGGAPGSTPATPTASPTATSTAARPTTTPTATRPPATPTAAVASVSPSAVATATTQPTVDPSATRPAEYTVQPDDTLAAIAARFGVTVEALAELNAITDPDYIYVGQVLLIPPSTP